jgi:hypothetical protein
VEDLDGEVKGQQRLDEGRATEKRCSLLASERGGAPCLGGEEQRRWRSNGGGGGTGVLGWEDDDDMAADSIASEGSEADGVAASGVAGWGAPPQGKAVDTPVVVGSQTTGDWTLRPNPS